MQTIHRKGPPPPPEPEPERRPAWMVRLLGVSSAPAATGPDALPDVAGTPPSLPAATETPTNTEPETSAATAPRVLFGT